MKAVHSVPGASICSFGERGVGLRQREEIGLYMSGQFSGKIILNLLAEKHSGLLDVIYPKGRSTGAAAAVALWPATRLQPHQQNE